MWGPICAIKSVGPGAMAPLKTAADDAPNRSKLLPCPNVLPAPVMAPEYNCWGARVVKVPTLSGVQESLQTMPIVLPKKTKNKRSRVLRSADGAWKFRW